MTPPTGTARPISARELPAPRRWRSTPLLRYVQVSWSAVAAARAVRAVIVVPCLFALTFKIIGDPQMTLFAVFGSFGTLILTSFSGTRRDKAIAHLGLAVVGSAALVIGTLASGSAWLAAIVTVPVAFAINFAGVLGPAAAAGVTGALLAFVLPVASAGGASTLGSRLAGWWLAAAVSTAAVLALSPRSAGDRLRAGAADLAAALAHQLEAAVAGTAAAADREASVAAKHELITMFAATPYRPVGLADADQGLTGVIHLLEWSTGLIGGLIDGHLDLRDAAAEDRTLLARSAGLLRSASALLSGREAQPDLDLAWQARSASATHLRALAGDPARVRRRADQAFHAQIIGIAASAAAADALLASRRASAERIVELRRRWVAGQPAASPPPPRRRRRRLAGPVMSVGADASIRSVWFRNAARGAVALAAAVAVAKLINVQHAFWVVLGTLSVLRTSATATGGTALRALAGTVAGFIVGAALLLAIGDSPAALWIAFPVAVLVAAYAPGTAPFTVGQAAFTVTIVVLFNLLVPAGWRVGLLRVEDVAIGCAVSAIVGVVFWPRGAASLVGDNLADSFRRGADYLLEAAGWALGTRSQRPGRAPAVLAAGIRLDDALRGYLAEQGAKRLPRHDLYALVMSAMQLRLTAYSLASLPGDGRSGWDPGPGAHADVATVRTALEQQTAQLADFYAGLAAQVARPGRNHADGAEPAEIAVPGGLGDQPAQPCHSGPAHYHPEALWVADHLRHLGSEAAGVTAAAVRLSRLRRTPWWR